MAKDAQRLGLYQRDEEEDVVDLGKPQQGTEFGQRYAKSHLIAMREENERRWEEVEKEREVAREAMAQKQREQKLAAQARGELEISEQEQVEPDAVAQARQRLSQRTGLVRSADQSAELSMCPDGMVTILQWMLAANVTIVEQGRQAREKYNKYWEEKAQVIKDKEAPNMSAVRDASLPTTAQLP